MVTDKKRDFSDVDRSSDPERYIRYLEAARGDRNARYLKKLSYASLEITEGMSVIDCGCGIGDDVRELAKMCGGTGKVVGLDASGLMIDKAKEYSEGLALPGEFVLGSIENIEFPNENFDGCRAERVLQHVNSPENAFAEMVRIVRPNGKIAVIETDFSSMTTHLNNEELSRKLTLSYMVGIKNPYIARQLPCMFRKFGLKNIKLTPYVNISTHCNSDDINKMWLEENYFSDNEIFEIKNDLRQLTENGQYFSMQVSFVMSGYKN